ncbi:MAG: helix-turn-helix transcriptional regulator [Cyclobacteriaceae bacterium]|nr:helix-turn-helix transcriptional regulator [Cyclobacteriaceae bacterium]
MNFRDERLLKGFGRHLQKIRKSKGITQEELAYRSNLSLSQIARIETGVINPTLCTMAVIAKNLGIGLKELLDF